MKLLFIALFAIPTIAVAQVKQDRVSASDILSKAINREVKAFTMSSDTIDRIDLIENGTVVRYTGKKLQALIRSIKSIDKYSIDTLARRAFDDDWNDLMNKKARN